jgi:hypothetical protein
MKSVATQATESNTTYPFETAEQAAGRVEEDASFDLRHRELIAAGADLETLRRELFGETPAPAWVLEAFDEFNAEHFDGKLQPIRVIYKTDVRWARRRFHSKPGGMICTAPTQRVIEIWDGTVKLGRQAVLDVLLHEMVHQYVSEALQIGEQTHGATVEEATFRDECERIGRKFGWSRPTSHRWPSAIVGGAK